MGNAFSFLVESTGFVWNNRKRGYDIDYVRLMGCATGFICCSAMFWLTKKEMEMEMAVANKKAKVMMVPLAMFLKHIKDRTIQTIKFSDHAPFGAIHFHIPGMGDCMSNLLPGMDSYWKEVINSNVMVEAYQEISPWDPIIGNLDKIIDVLGLIVSLGSLWYFMRKQTNNQNMEQPDNRTITFDDVAGLEETKMELREVISYLEDPGQFSALGARPPRGVLLSGPSGTGKTLLAKAVAGESDVPFLYQSASSFVELYVGQGAARVRDFFHKARKIAPCICFLDELDALGHSRDSGDSSNHEYCQTVNQLLCELDGLRDDIPWCFIGATNRFQALDSALVRPGRIDRIIHVPLPDLVARAGCLAVHLRKIRISNEKWDLTNLAKSLDGWNGAEIANLINESALRAARKKESAVQLKHIEEVIQRTNAARAEQAQQAEAASQQQRQAADFMDNFLSRCFVDPAEPVDPKKHTVEEID